MAKFPWQRRGEMGVPKVPEEVEQYYESTRKERAGMAWLLGLATLVITVLLAIGLYFGGRWIYRKITHKDNSQQTTQEEKPQEQSPSNQSPQAPATLPGSDEGSRSDEHSQPESNAQNNQNNSVQTPSAEPAPSTNQPQANDRVPNTGPEGVLGIAALVAIVSTFAHTRLTARREQ